MEYLASALKIDVKYTDWDKVTQLPYLIADRYEIRAAFLDNKKVLFAYPKAELDQIAAVKKHIERIKHLENIPVVLIFERLTARQRQYLINAGIPFIAVSKQIYLPFMGMLLQSKCDPEQEDLQKLSPSAQVLLLYYIYRSNTQLYMSDAVDNLGFSAMTITRAVRQLADIGLVSTRKEGVLIIIEAKEKGKELFSRARPYLTSPIRKRIYIAKNAVSSALTLAGYSALSRKTMMNLPQVSCYAAINISDWKKNSTSRLTDADSQVCLEIWTYDPTILASEGIVDTLSLSLSLGEDHDERVEACVKDMLNDYWREYHGQGT